MNIVVPMAGRGSRFAAMGITVPKPLIEVRGRPMYTWAVESLPLMLADRLIFICLEEHLRDLRLRRDIEDRYAATNPVLVSVDQVTRGQACTVLTATHLINNETPLLIYNADTYCRSSLEECLAGRERNADAILGVFEAEGEQWSFARLDEIGRVVETSEKRRISPLASTGLYYFRRGRDFVYYATEMIDAGEAVGGEYYVAPVFNRMIARGADIRVAHAKEVWSLGTPGDLAYFETHFSN